MVEKLFGFAKRTYVNLLGFLIGTLVVSRLIVVGISFGTSSFATLATTEQSGYKSYKIQASFL